MVEERPATMYKISKAAEQTKKSTKIASPQITVHVFRSSPGAKHLIFQPEFPDFPYKW